MASRALRSRLGGLRARLTLLLAAILAAALALAFAATYSGTGDQVRHQIDQDLREDVDAFSAQGVPRGGASPAELERRARAYVNNQPSFGPLARLFLVSIPGRGVVTNEPTLIGVAGRLDEVEPPPRSREEGRQGLALRRARPGFTTVQVDEVGGLRLLVAPVRRDGREIARVGVGEALGAVQRAQAGVARAFALTGIITLALAMLAVYLVASRASRPLRRMARTAALIDAGELSHRMDEPGPPTEVHVLAEAFDRALDRLTDAFSRQRDFVADASHELRTPLTVIRGQLEVLARRADPGREEVRRVEGVVRTEVLRMERLVEDLLLLARADQGELLRLEALELERFLPELFDGLTLTAERRWELGEVPLGVLHADPDRLAQVLRNLARNAVEHTGPGGLVRLQANVRGERLELSIEDDGPGIPPEQRELVFDRFHRMDVSRARAAGGTGLGLAIARAIVEAHGGRISAGASPAGGARLAVELPGFVPSAAVAPRAPAIRAAARE